jgi:hypothetical protein
VAVDELCKALVSQEIATVSVTILTQKSNHISIDQKYGNYLKTYLSTVRYDLFQNFDLWITFSPIRPSSKNELPAAQSFGRSAGLQGGGAGLM